MIFSTHEATQRYFLMLLGAAIRGDTDYPKPPADINWNEFLLMTINSGFVETVLQAFEATNFDGVDSNLKTSEKLIKEREYLLFCDTQRMYEVNLLFDEFERRGIKYLPLKGWVVKDYYPDSLMRDMNDVDILFNMNENSVEEISAAFKACGFVYLKHIRVHSIYVKGRICIEAHEKLLSSWSSYDDYYANDWDVAKHTSGCRYDMTAEDAYIYMLLHFDKHLNGEGAKIRVLLDLYVWRIKHNLDYEYINRELKKLNLVCFESNIRTLELVWFERHNASQAAADISYFLLRGNIHPQISGKLLVLNRLKDPAYFKKKVFSSKNELGTAFPIINRKPMLIPICWVLNMFQILFFRLMLIILNPFVYNANKKIHILHNVDISK